METIRITLLQVSDCAAQIRNVNLQLNQNLQDVTMTMQHLSDSWQSPASETIRQRFMAMLPIFENYRTIIDNYAKFLDNTVTTYQNIENQINLNADTFQ